MIFQGADRDGLRRTFVDAWRKRRDGRPLEPLEALLGDVVAEHPEYHRALEDPDAIGRDFAVEDGETNPFLHLAMHVAIREQVGADRPPGARAAHARLAAAAGVHDAEHRMMEILAESLWEAQRAGRPPDEAAYLERLARLSHRSAR